MSPAGPGPSDVPQDAAILARARGLAATLAGEPGFLGAYLGGSSSRPGADEHSDLDVFAVYEDDAFAQMSERQRYRVHIDRGPPRRKDWEIMALSWSTFSGYPTSTWDLYHFQFSHDVLLADPAGRLAPVMAAARALPDELRLDRLEVHYVELHYYVGKTVRCLQRGVALDAKLTASRAVWSFAKCWYLLHGRWVAKPEFASSELARCGASPALLAELERALDAPSQARLEGLVATLDAALVAAGFAFQQGIFELNRKMCFDDAVRPRFHRWAERQ